MLRIAKIGKVVVNVHVLYTSPSIAIKLPTWMDNSSPEVSNSYSASLGPPVDGPVLR